MDKIISDNGKYQYIESKKEQELSTLDLVSRLLAIEVVDYWLQGQDYPMDCSVALNQLFRIEIEDEEMGLIAYLISSKSNLESLVEEAEIRIDYLYKKHFTKDKINWTHYLDKELKNWYFASDNGWHQLKSNAKKSRERILNKFEQSILCLDEASSQKSLEFLSELFGCCQAIEGEYAHKVKECEEKEIECQRIYLRNQLFLQEKRVKLSEINKVTEITIKTIKNLYRYKILKESYNLAIQIIKDLLGNIQKYIEQIEKTISLFEETKKNLEVEKLPLILMYHKTDKFIDLEAISQKMEQKLVHSLHNLGSNYANITPGMIEKALLEAIKPFADLSNNYWRSWLNQEFKSNQAKKCIKKESNQK